MSFAGGSAEFNPCIISAHLASISALNLAFLAAFRASCSAFSSGVRSGLLAGGGARGSLPIMPGGNSVALPPLLSLETWFDIDVSELARKCLLIFSRIFLRTSTVVSIFASAHGASVALPNIFLNISVSKLPI